VTQAAIALLGSPLFTDAFGVAGAGSAGPAASQAGEVGAITRGLHRAATFHWHNDVKEQSLELLLQYEPALKKVIVYVDPLRYIMIVLSCFHYYAV
jgi:hypothetical protein